MEGDFIMDYISIGQIVNTHGIKGELKIYPLTDDMKRYRKLEYVYIDGQKWTVVWCKLQPTTVILKLENLDKVEDAAMLKNKYLEVERSNAIKLPEGRYFVADIIGCMVSDTNGAELGKIDDVIFTGSNEVYWIKGDKELLIPALKSVVLNMDVANKKIVIRPVETWQ